MDKPLFAVIGLGRFGRAVAEQLANMGMDVLAIDDDEDKVNEISNIVNHVVQLNATNESALKEIGIKDADVVVVAVGEDIAASILICSFLKNDLKIKKVIAKANNPKHGTVLSKLSVDSIIYPEKESGNRLAKKLVSPNIFDLIDLSDTYSILELRAPESFIEKTLAELELRKKYNVTVIAVKRKTPEIMENNLSGFFEDMFISPNSTFSIVQGDILVMIGEKVNLEIIKNLS